MSETLDVLVLGDANPDLVLRGDVVPRFDQAEHLLDSAEFVIGGSGAITAHALTRLGLRTRLLASVGDDPLGVMTREQLVQAGVDVTAVVVSARPTGLSVVLSDGPRRATLTHIGAIDADPPTWRVPGDIPRARHLHIASYYLQRRVAAELPRLLPLVRDAGLTVSLDTNLDPTGRFGGLAEVLSMVDVFLPNAAEARAAARSVTGRSFSDPAAAAGALAAAGGCAVVVKDGANGAVLARGGLLLREPGRTLDPVDTTGAGDSFNAGYLASYLAGEDDATALRWACATGAAATQAAGGCAGHLTRAELDELLASP